MPSLKYSVVASLVSEDLREAPRAARELGFAGLLLDAYGPDMRIPDLSGSGRRELRRLLATEKQDLVGLRVDMGAKGFGPGVDVDRLLLNLDRAMEAAKDLAGPLMCIDLGRLPGPGRTAAAKIKITPEPAGNNFLSGRKAPDE